MKRSYSLAAMLAPLPVASLASLASLVCACSSTTASDAPAADAGGDVTVGLDATPPPLDAGADALTDADAPADALPPDDGSLVFGPAGLVVWTSENGPDGGPYGFQVLPNFLTGTAAVSHPCANMVGPCCISMPATCTVYSDGSSTCTGDAGGPSGDGGSTPPPPDAGPCGIFDNNANAGLLTVSDNGAVVAQAPWTVDGYTVGSDAGIGWAPGDVLGAAASGGQCFASFSGTVPAVAPIHPAFPATVSASADLRVTWTPDPAAQEVLIEMSPELVGVGAQISCSGSDSAGALTIPAAALGLVGSGQTLVTIARRGSATAVSKPDIGLVSVYEDLRILPLAP